MKNWLLHNHKVLFWTLLLLVLGSGIWLRHIGIEWGDLSDPRKAITFHPDEPKFMLIAQEFLKDDFSFRIHYSRPLDYLKTTGAKIASAARLVHFFFDSFSVKNLYLIGRYISLIYGVLTLLVIYGIGWLLFKNRWKALLALFFLAFASLHTEHSHYATGDVSSLFWIYFSVLMALLRVQNPKPWQLTLLSFSVGMTLAIKFSFVPLIILLYVLFCSKSKINNLFVSCLIIIGTFFLANGFYYTADDFKIFWNMAFSDNISMRDHHKWLNPFTYLFGLASSVGLITFLFFISSFFQKKFKNFNRDKLFILYLPFAIYFVAICLLDVPFSRHLLPLIPLICLAAADSAGRFAQFLWTQNRIKTLIALFLFIFSYQFLYNYSIQRYFDRDPRYKVQRWFDKKVPKGTPIAATKYAHLSSGHHILPNIDNHLHQAEYVILHESYYYRYFRSELNPLKTPKNVNEVYRGSTKNLKSVHALFKNELPFRLVKEFKIKTFTPELWLYKKTLGTFPLFLGDMLVYKRISEGESPNEQKNTP